MKTTAQSGRGGNTAWMNDKFMRSPQPALFLQNSERCMQSTRKGQGIQSSLAMVAEFITKKWQKSRLTECCHGFWRNFEVKPDRPPTA